MITPSYGVVVARCQVHELHDGHLSLFREVRARHNRVIVFLGQKPIGPTYKNPLDFETRKAMIQAKFPDFYVLPLNDCSEDETWSRRLDEKIHEIADYGDVTLYGGRDSFIPHYKGHYKPVELALPKVETNGTSIREKLTNTVMESADFRAGVIYAMANLRPRVIPCVDVVIKYSNKFLLGRKPGETCWRFVGGHAEPNTTSFEMDARNEVMEEAGLDLSNLTYIGSTLVNDWRWADEPSKIKTMVFVGQASSMAARAGDDIEAVRWLKWDEIKRFELVEAHQGIYNLVTKWYNTIYQEEENVGTV